jgi:hypothetical protein
MAGMVVGVLFLGMVLAGISGWGFGRTYMADRIRRVIRTTGDLEMMKKELEKVPTFEGPPA